MSCEKSEVELQGYLDGELDAAGMANFERHARSCPDCGPLLAAEKSLRNSLQSASLYERAPSALREKIERQFAPRTSPSRSGALVWSLLGAAVVLLAVLAGWRPLRPGSEQGGAGVVASAALDAHLRSLQPGHLADVASTDQHTVKPWFDGRIDFAPPVRDLVEQGFPLVGGRLDVLQGQTVAVLVYGRRKHVINVFVWKTSTLPSVSGSGENQGYHWLDWDSGGLTFHAVSDVSVDDLKLLRQLLTEAH